MKNRVAYLFIALLSAVALGFSIPGEDPLTALLSRLEKFRSDFPQEKIHIQIDKPYYSIGDTIWFKSYVVDAETNRPSATSSVLYAELINEKDSIAQFLRLPVLDGGAAGDFVLSDSLREGNYRLRAYTSWMRNFDEEYFYDRTITIGNALSNPVLADISYTFSTSGIKENVEAVITYTGYDKKPLANKAVSYEVQLDSRSISRGSGTTGEDGKLKVNFTNAQPFILKAGQLTTRIQVDDKQVIKVFPVKSTASTVSVQFFPEGGQLVDSIRSCVAFKAVSSDGSGVPVSGYIADIVNNKITDIATDHAGMGSFFMTPLSSKGYIAHLRLNDGSEKLVPLPSALHSGYVMNITSPDTNSFVLKVAGSRNLMDKRTVMLIGQGQNVVKYRAVSDLKSPVFTAVVPKDRFPPGIVQFTLFTGDGTPVAERICFNRGKMLAIAADTRPSYGKREKVDLALTARNSAGQPMQGIFSTAVTNITKAAVNEADEPSILSQLLLSSDIKGYIEQPNYYFTQPSATKDRQLDLLLLTQGWRRFLWKELQSGSFPSITYPAEKTLTISGRVVDKNEKPVEYATVTLLSTSGTTVVRDTLTGRDGTFHFTGLSFEDKTQFLLQAVNEKKQKTVGIEVDRVPQQLVTRNKNSPDLTVTVSPARFAYLSGRKNEFDELRANGLLKKTILLNEVKLTAVKQAAINSSNLNGAGNADVVIKSDKFQNYSSLAQALDGRYAGVVIQNGMAYLSRYMNTASIYGAVPMYLVVDGMQSPANYLSSIPPSSVEVIEILKSPGNLSLYGSNGSAGVMIVTTKRGEYNLNYAKFTTGMTSFSPKGYYYGRAFYAPDVENPEVAKKITDHRTTVYWNPDVVTGPDGKAGLKFFTTDDAGQYRAVIEGIAADGTIGRKVVYFTVK